MNKKIGVFLSRMQPLHNGHIGIIDKALSENDKVIILIGSANKEGTIRNPIGINLRKEILKETLENEYQKDNREKIEIVELPDWSTETDIASNLEWGRYLYYNVVSKSKQRNFTMYFSDEPEIVENWFQDKIIRTRINLRIFKRAEMFEAVSSTKIRNAFLNNNKEYIEKSVPKAIIERFDIIKDILNKVYTEPLDDKSMEDEIEE